MHCINLILKKHADSLAFWALNDAEWSSLCAEFTGPLTTYYEKFQICFNFRLLREIHICIVDF